MACHRNLTSSFLAVQPHLDDLTTLGARLGRLYSLNMAVIYEGPLKLRYLLLVILLPWYVHSCWFFAAFKHR